MKVSLVGSGRVATHVAGAIHNIKISNTPENHVTQSNTPQNNTSQRNQIVQIFSRNLDNAQQLALKVNAQAIDQYEQLNTYVDLIIIAVQDQTIDAVMAQVAKVVLAQQHRPLIVHTSGSTDIDVLAQYYDQVGVFYPLQTFSFEKSVDWSKTPLLIEALHRQDLHILKQLAEHLSEHVYLYSSEQRLNLHLAAVFACNFTNYCYDMAKQVSDAQQIDFALLHPLMLETAQKAIAHEPSSVQTGPAVRGDRNIIQRHLELLKNAQQSDLEQIYNCLSQQIMKRHQVNENK